MKRARRHFQEIKDEEDGWINLTPLIDVVFVVLFAFIIIAPLLEIDLVELSEGKEGRNQTFEKSSKIQITVDKNNAIFFNDQKIALSDLNDFLQSGKGNIPQLFLDKEAPFGTYQTIKNILENAGFDELQVILKPR